LSDRPSGTLFGTLRLFADITRFRKGPEDLPASPALLAFCVVVGITAQALLVGLIPTPVEGNALAIIVINAGVTLAFLALVLNLAKRPERYLQTATAAFGFQLVVLPIAMGVGWLYLLYSTDPVWKTPVFMLRIALEIWGLIVMTRILNSATGWSLFACVVLTITRDVLFILTIVSLFPQAAAAAAAPA
jgi:hypothetical protein